MQLVLDTHNISLRQRNNSFLVSAGTERRMISPHRISSIAVISPCTITSAAVLLATAHKIPIIFFDHSGEPEAQVWSTHFGNMAELRRAQVLFGISEGATEWAAELFRLKTQGQIENLEWVSSIITDKQMLDHLMKTLTKMKGFTKQFNTITDQKEPFLALMNIESLIARQYWPAWGGTAPSGFTFVKRSRRPATDMYNAALNYVYGMLYNIVEGAVLAAGMDPMFGIIHADEFGAPTLVFDMIEPFRPQVDRFLHSILNGSLLDARHFEPTTYTKASGISVNRLGRKILIEGFNNFLQETVNFRDQKQPFKQHIYIFAGELATKLKAFWENDPSGKLRHRKRPASLESGE